LPNIPPANAIKEIIQEKYKKLWTSYGKLSKIDKLDWFQRFMVIYIYIYIIMITLYYKISNRSNRILIDILNVVKIYRENVHGMNETMT
jgi:hypothetical protein